MTPTTRFKLRLTLEGPILTGATNPGAIGVDSPFARRGGKLYFPGTLVKGKLLQSWRELDGWSTHIPKLAEREKWFGKQTGNEDDNGNEISSFEPARGRVYFSDLVDESAGDRLNLRYRICMDEMRGSADEGMLQLLESPYGSGESATFEGTLDFIPANDNELARFREAVRIGLLAVPAFGAERGIGFGRLRSVTLDLDAGASSVTHSIHNDQAETVGLVLTTTDLLCIAERQPATNLFRSSEVIPGGALKGAIAQMMALQKASGAQFPLLEANLSLLRIRHARPIPATEPALAPSAIPLSAVMAKSKDWYDAAFCSRALLVDRIAPTFQPDWKTAFGKHPCRELRVRTRIDTDRRRAKDENLFAYESIVTAGFQWITNIDLRHIAADDRPGVLGELKILLASGLFGVGKTKARFLAPISDAILPQYASDTQPRDGRVVIQLEAPALLGRPSRWERARNATNAHSLYAEVWGELSEGSMELSHHFALQDMSGGYYQHRRFRPRDPYQPWVLTREGSVFILNIRDEAKAVGLLDRWLVTGLPLEPQRGLCQELGLGAQPFNFWRCCPFVPENGYGEIGVNLHRSRPNEVLEANNA